MILALAPMVRVFATAFGAPLPRNTPRLMSLRWPPPTSDAINVTVTVEGVDIPYTEVPVF